MVVLEDAVLAKLLASGELMAKFPTLAPYVAQSTAKKGCKPCAKKNKQNVVNYNAAKQAIANLPAAKKIELKQALKTDQLRLYYRNATGQTVKLTF